LFQRVKEQASKMSGFSPSPQVRHYEEDCPSLMLDAHETANIALELTSNTALTRLILHGSSRGGDCIVVLAGALAANKSLSSLSLVGVGVGNIGMEALARAMMQNDSLEVLCLDRNMFDTAGLTSFTNALKINKGLRSLSLDFNSIDDEGATAMADALKLNATLTSLHLHRNNIHDKGAMSMLNVLTEWNTTLANIGLDILQISRTIVSAIFTVLGANSSEIRLLRAEADQNLSSKSINAGRAKCIANDLVVNTVVTTLVLNVNDIGDQGATYLAKALIKNSSLTSIELDDNGIGNIGLAAISMALKENDTLAKLFLNGNSMDLAGATALAETIRVSTSLRHLALRRNAIGNDSALAIADALKLNTALAILDLESNNISDDGATALLRVFQNHNFSLKLLKLEGNTDVSRVLHEALASQPVLNSFLKHLRKPLETRAVPLAIQAMNMGSISHEESENGPCLKANGTAGFVFHVVKATAVNASKVSSQGPV
jgi:NLR family CARD domain-containing protein 3